MRKGADSCRLRDGRTAARLDKAVFRRDLGNLSEAYAEVAKRLGILPEGVVKPARGPKLVP